MKRKNSITVVGRGNIGAFFEAETKREKPSFRAGAAAKSLIQSRVFRAI